MRGLVLILMLSLLSPVTGLSAELASAPGCPRVVLDAFLGDHSYKEAIERKLLEAKQKLTENPFSDLRAIERELVALQAKYLESLGVKFRLDPRGRWIDILPGVSGHPLNLLASKAAVSPLHQIVRYQPEVLFKDAYSVLDPPVIFKGKALYLSHRDVMGDGPSRFLTDQMHGFEQKTEQRLKLQRENPDAPSHLFHEPEVTSQDYEKDWWKEARTESDGKTVESAVAKYLKQSKVVPLIYEESDPIVVGLSPNSFYPRGNKGRSIFDLRGLIKEQESKEGFNVTTLKGDWKNAEATAFDMFIQDAFIYRYPDAHPENLRRALTIPSGSTLVHVQGSAHTKSYFESYLSFLEKVYKSPSGLGMDASSVKKLKEASLDFSDRSELFAWAKDSKWITNKEPEDMIGGLIAVKSEKIEEPLPIERAHPGLTIPRPVKEGEMVVEMGRLTSLTPGATLDFLKMASTSLYYRYPKRPIRIICEADAARARLFKRFGFKEAALKITDKSYYKSGTEVLLEVDLSEFLKAVLKRAP